MDQLLIKKLIPEAILPTKAHTDDAGWDLYASVDALIMPTIYQVETKIVIPNQPKQLPNVAVNLAITEIKTDITMAIPVGYYGQIGSRSGLGKRGLRVHPGVIDSGYRGEVTVLVQNQGRDPIEIKKGDRIAQLLLLPVPAISIQEVNELPVSERGESGFGSSGR